MTETTQEMGSVGERLHKARLKKKVTIEEVYKDTRVHPKIIAALEEDRYDEFLSPTYIKAFLKSYCRYLDVDANKILSDYDKVRKGLPDVTLNISPPQKSQTLLNVNWRKYAELSKRWVLPVSSGIIAVFLFISVISLTSKAAKSVVRGFGRLKPNASQVAASKGPSIIKALSISSLEGLALIVKTKGDVWLEVKSDGKTVFKSVLKKGSVEAYKANEKFHLWTGKGEYLDLVLNGHPLGSPGSGVIKKILLTREGLSIEKK